MLNNNHHNPSCAFAEQIVSYLYGEAGTKEKAAFHVHLNSCSNCADELAGFGFVRSSIVEWKKEEFSNLETPSIKIPYPIAVSTEKQSWVTELRKLFALSPAWSTALAVAAVCVGLTLLVFNFSNSNEVAEDNNKPMESVVLPIVEMQVEQPKESISDETANQTPMDKQSKPSEIAPRVAPKNRIIKATNNPTKNNSVEQNSNNVANVRKIKDDKNTLAVQKQRVPKLNNLEEEEDNSLRLADLFTEDVGK
jgi:hypothetical protein